jgi:hypothetical protein
MYKNKLKMNNATITGLGHVEMTYDGNSTTEKKKNQNTALT